MAKCSGLNQTVAHSYKRFVRIPMVSNFGLLNRLQARTKLASGAFHSSRLFQRSSPVCSSPLSRAPSGASRDYETVYHSSSCSIMATQRRLHNQLFSLGLHPINILIFCRGFCFYIHRLSSYPHRWVYSGWYWPLNHLFGKQWAILQGFHSSFQPWEGEPAITIKPTGCWPPRLSWSLFD